MVLLASSLDCITVNLNQAMYLIAVARTEVSKNMTGLEPAAPLDSCISLIISGTSSRNSSKTSGMFSFSSTVRTADISPSELPASQV